MKAGDVQWMTAERGFEQRGHNKNPVHTLHLWFNLPADKKMIEPQYRDLRGDQVTVRKEEQQGGLEVRGFSGKSGNVKGLETISNQAPITMLNVVIKNNEGTLFTQKIPAGQEGFVLILSGQRRFGKDASNTFTEDLLHN